MMVGTTSCCPRSPTYAGPLTWSRPGSALAVLATALTGRCRFPRRRCSWPARRSRPTSFPASATRSDRDGRARRRRRADRDFVQRRASTSARDRCRRSATHRRSGCSAPSPPPPRSPSPPMFCSGSTGSVAGVLGAALAPTDPAVMFSVLGPREVGGRSGDGPRGRGRFQRPRRHRIACWGWSRLSRIRAPRCCGAQGVRPGDEHRRDLGALAACC